MTRSHRRSPSTGFPQRSLAGCPWRVSDSSGRRSQIRSNRACTSSSISGSTRWSSASSARPQVTCSWTWLLLAISMELVSPICRRAPSCASRASMSRQIERESIRSSLQTCCATHFDRRTATASAPPQRRVRATSVTRRLATVAATPVSLAHRRYGCSGPRTDAGLSWASTASRPATYAPQATRTPISPRPIHTIAGAGPWRRRRLTTISAAPRAIGTTCPRTEFSEARPTDRSQVMTFARSPLPQSILLNSLTIAPHGPTTARPIASSSSGAQSCRRSTGPAGGDGESGVFIAGRVTPKDGRRLPGVPLPRVGHRR